MTPLDLALAAYLFAGGARTPLLAFVAFRRLRAWVAVVVPAAAAVAVATLVAGAGRETERVGSLALAVAPASLAAPGIVAVLRGRADAAGAYLAGSLALSFVLCTLFAPALGPGAAATFRNASFGLVAGLAVASVPPLRAVVAPLSARVSDLALVALVLLTWQPALAAFNGVALGAAVLLLAGGVGTAAVAARLAGTDVTATVAAAGVRDFAIGLALASAVDPRAAAAPLAYGALVVLAAALLVAFRRT